MTNNINTESITAFTDTLQTYRNRTEKSLENAILSQFTSKELPIELRDAMLYATLNGGKRLRPILVYATGQCLGQSLDVLDYVAAAIECIHCYSLIHDDLPAMDDDHLRRGKPTTHIAFGEATAILAGDALLTLAFELLSQPMHAINPETQLKMIHLLATQAGSAGMIGGQSLDLLAEGKTISEPLLEKIHRLKTGALIQASVMLGALAANRCDPETLQNLNAFSARIGLAFQLQDDLLDVIGNTKALGKNTGQDEKQQKATHTILFGETATKTRIQTLMQEAMDLLKSTPHNTDFLVMLCNSLMKREG